jgi:hypothetical protein
VDKLADLQNTSLLESPGGQLVCKFTVGGLDGLAVQLGAFREPLVLQQLGGSDNSQARGIVGLHRRNQIQLLANCKGILDALSLVLGAVAVCCARGTEDGRKKRRFVSEDLAHGARHRNVSIASKVVLDARAKRAGKIEQQNIVRLRCRCRVVVEMIHHHCALVCRNANVEFEECCLDSCGCDRFAGQRDENVSLLLQEFEKVVRGERRAEAFRFAGKQEDVVVCSLAMSE